jgi:hypothetical protein
MRRRAISRISATLLVAAALGLSVAAAHAGPCSSRIAQFEQAVRQSAGNPNAGPMAPQSIGAQLDVQPTPASIKRAEEQAKATFAATLARAKRLDKQGNRVGCTRALAAAKCPSEDFLIPLNHLDSMEPILIRGGAYIVDGQEPGEVRPRSLEISERPD